MELPEQIIHRTQSFLAEEEAARSTILSKSWRSACLTRPNLDFDETEFYSRTRNSKQHWYDRQNFLDFVKETLQRYAESNLKIHSFGLSMSCSSFNGSARAAGELIVKALEIGATRLALDLGNTDLVVPNEVFASENLVELYMKRCRVGDPNVACSRLESLTLANGSANTSFVPDIVSRCPLITKMSFSGVYEYTSGVIIERCGPIEIRTTKSALWFKAHSLFLGDVFSNYHSLKDLTLHLQFILPYLRISSPSLELLDISITSVDTSEFDVPSIRKFTFKGPVRTPLVFKSTSSEWESHVSFVCTMLRVQWFVELNKFLMNLSKSRIYLTLGACDKKSFDYDVKHIHGLPKPEVEDLIMDIEGLPSLSCYALFDCLFRICRPKTITQYLLPKSVTGWKTNNHFLCKTLVQETSEKCSTQSLGMPSLVDLKEVSVQVFDEADGEWLDISRETLLDAPSPTKNQRIRFRLGWES